MENGNSDLFIVYVERQVVGQHISPSHIHTTYALKVSGMKRVRYVGLIVLARGLQQSAGKKIEEILVWRPFE